MMNMSKKQLEVEQSEADFDTPPPPYSTIQSSQTLNVDYRHWKSDITITNSAGEQLFLSQSQYCSTRLEVFDWKQQRIGSSKSSKLTSKIEVDLQSASGVQRSFEMHNSLGVMGGSPKYHSPSFNGTDVTWRNKAMSTKIIYDLLDGRGTTYARFQSNPKTKIGTLELGDVTDEDCINEIVVTLVSLLARKLRNIEMSYLVAVT